MYLLFCLIQKTVAGLEQGHYYIESAINPDVCLAVDSSMPYKYSNYSGFYLTSLDCKDYIHMRNVFYWTNTTS